MGWRVCRVAAVLWVLGGVSAAVASANYLSEAEHTIFKAAQTQTVVLKTNVGNVSCTTFLLKGTAFGSELEEGDYASEELLLEPSLSGCKLAGVNVTATTTGCVYTFATPTATEPVGTADASLKLACEGSKEVIFKDTSGFGCEVKLKSQTAGGQVMLTSEGTGKASDLLANAELTGLSYSWTAGCPNAEGKAGSNSNGTYAGSLTIKATTQPKNKLGSGSGRDPPCSGLTSIIQANTLTWTARFL